MSYDGRMNHKFRGLALHTWTVDATPLEGALAAAKAAGFDAVELRHVDLLCTPSRAALCIAQRSCVVVGTALLPPQLTKECERPALNSATRDGRRDLRSAM